MSVEVAEPPAGGVTEVGDRVHVAPVGHPETLKLTAELKPFNDVTVIVEVLLLPFLMLSELGDADREKSDGADGAVTVRLTVVE